MSEEEAQAFIEENHKQGSVKTVVKKKALGLYYGNELVEVVQFCAPRTSAMQRRYTTELLRLCTKKAWRVVGGASKLVKEYKRLYKPFDFFTYQDTTGESTSVYEHCGMTLVSQAAKKDYLVAPGKTLETGSRREVLGMAYAVRFGPDRILGTKLGEVFDPETGKRKSNRRIFLEELGWHVETTSGDRVYEWVDEAVTHYGYRITASDSDKYYFGVSHLKKADATMKDCLTDGYWGSGKNKFSNWKSKHRGHLQKQVLVTSKRRAEILQWEKEAIGESYKTDSQCLNAMPGGVARPPVGFKDIVSVKECPIHGESKHSGGTCMKCSSTKTFTRSICPLHGESPFIGSTCQLCNAQSFTRRGVCAVHGETTFQHGKCKKCEGARALSKKTCSIHGLTIHHGSTCSKCQTEASDSYRECPKHGLTLHRGSNCFKCSNEKAVTVKTCPLHGETKFLGDQCYLCRKPAAYTDTCPTHGPTKFKGGKCCKCSNRMTTIEVCEIHGEGKFQWGKCCKCRFEAKTGRASPLPA